MKVLRAGAAAVTASAIAVAMGAPLELVTTIPLPGVKGRIDHMSVDVEGHRLFVAALGNDTVEVVDTRTASVRTLKGFGEPQGVLFVPESNRLFVANGGADRVDVLDASTFAPLKRVERMSDADNVRHDRGAKRVAVGHGDGALRFLDATSADTAYEIPLPGHPESFQLEQRGALAYVNVPSAHAVVVVDRTKRSVAATWKTGNASSNFPMALDEDGGRLFVGTRSPAAVLVYDTVSGRIVARTPIGGDTDDLFFDAARQRLYAVCGEGRIDVLRAGANGSFPVETSVETAPRARTGLFVPEESSLYVAQPASGPSPARILVYRVR